MFVELNFLLFCRIQNGDPRTTIVEQ
jgi:hypothetical protein